MDKAGEWLFSHSLLEFLMPYPKRGYRSACPRLLDTVSSSVFVIFSEGVGYGKAKESLWESIWIDRLSLFALSEEGE